MTVRVFDVDHVFGAHPPTPEQSEKYEAIRASAKDFAETIRRTTPGCADQTAALRKVREASMTANAAIALGGRFCASPEAGPEDVPRPGGVAQSHQCSDELSMGRYRKKPLVIEAVQWPNASMGCAPAPEWFCVAMGRGVMTMSGDRLYIKTLEGSMKVNPGDWIIRGIKGELYPCKSDIFAATYDPVDCGDDDAHRPAAYEKADAQAPQSRCDCEGRGD